MKGAGHQNRINCTNVSAAVLIVSTAEFWQVIFIEILKLCYLDENFNKCAKITDVNSDQHEAELYGIKCNKSLIFNKTVQCTFGEMCEGLGKWVLITKIDHGSSSIRYVLTINMFGVSSIFTGAGEIDLLYDAKIWDIQRLLEMDDKRENMEDLLCLKRLFLLIFIRYAKFSNSMK